MPLSRCLHDDAPWWRTYLKEARVDSINDDIDPAFAIAMGARSASEAIQERYLSGKAAEGKEDIQPGLVSLLRAPQFRHAIQRLLNHTWNDIDRVKEFTPTLERLLDCRVEMMDEIKVELRLYDKRIAEAQAEVAVDKQTNPPMVRILAGSSKHRRRRMSTALASLVGEAWLNNHAALEGLFEAEDLQELPTVLNERQIRAFTDFVEPTFGDEARDEQPREQEAGDEEAEGFEPDDEFDGGPQTPDQTGIASNGEEGGNGVQGGDRGRATASHQPSDITGARGSRSIAQGAQRPPQTQGESGVVNVRAYIRSMPGSGSTSEDWAQGSSPDNTTFSPPPRQSPPDRRPDGGSGRTGVVPTGSANLRSPSDRMARRVHWVDGYWRTNPVRVGQSGALKRCSWPRTNTNQSGDQAPGSASPPKNTEQRGPGRGDAVEVVRGNVTQPADQIKKCALAAVTRTLPKLGYTIRPDGGENGPDLWATVNNKERPAIVRGMTTDINDGVIELTRRDILLLLDQKWSWLLYVVSNIGSSRRTIYTIQNPLRHARGFRFGPEWHESATQVSLPATRPPPTPTPQRETPRQSPRPQPTKTKKGSR